MTSYDMAQRSYLQMRMMKQENPVKSIMMQLLSIGNQAFCCKHEIGICLKIYSTYIFLHNRLLDRDQVVDEETTLDDEDEDGFLKAFKVVLSYSRAYTFFATSVYSYLIYQHSCSL
jgi:hypothetical protein